MTGEDPTRYTLPLSEDEFTDAIRRGLGRAVLHIQEHGASGLEAIILDACCRNDVYDTQCEAQRGAYLQRIVESAHLTDSLRVHLLSALPGLVGASNLSQAIDLAVPFAEAGDEEMKRVIRDLFGERFATEGIAYTLASAVVRIDGVEGFVRAAVMPWDDEALQWVPGSLAGECEEHCAVSREELLEALGRCNGDEQRRFASALCGEAEAARASSPRARKPRLDSAAAFVEAVASEAFRDHRAALHEWYQSAQQGDIESVGDAFACERSPEQLARLLPFFRHRTPLSAKPKLLLLLDAPLDPVRDQFEGPTCRRVGYENMVASALGGISDPDIRRRAFVELDAGRTLRATRLLKANFQPGDEPALLAAIEALDECERHWGMMDCIKFFEEKPTDACLPLMLYVYARTPCTRCRADAVEVMEMAGVTPDHIRDEFPFDADRLESDSSWLPPFQNWPGGS